MVRQFLNIPEYPLVILTMSAVCSTFPGSFQSDRLTSPVLSATLTVLTSCSDDQNTMVTMASMLTWFSLVVVGLPISMTINVRLRLFIPGLRSLIGMAATVELLAAMVESII